MDVSQYLDKINKLPVPARLGVLGGVVVTISILYYFMIYLPHNQELGKINSNLKQLNSQLTEKKAIDVVNLIFKGFTDELKNNGRIEIRGFGSFVVKNYGSYMGRNPKTGTKIEVEPKKLPFFKVGKELKVRVDKKK